METRIKTPEFRNIGQLMVGGGFVSQFELAITHMAPGSATMRLLAGELGAGHA